MDVKRFALDSLQGPDVLGNPFAQHLKPLEDGGLHGLALQAPLPVQVLPDRLGNLAVVLRSRVFSLSLQDVHLVAISGPSIALALCESSCFSLLYVTAGEVSLFVDQVRWTATSGHCLLVPGGRLRWQSSSYSLVCLMLDWAHVSDLLGLFSSDGAAMTSTLSGHRRPRLISSLNSELAASLLASLDQILRLVSVLIRISPSLLNRLGLAGQIARLVILLAFPDLCSQAALGPVQDRPGELRTAFDDLIDYIRANLDQALNLTVLERRSNYSRRTLQYAFRERFGCTATQWIRSQRLDLAYRLLRNPGSEATVTSIAQACGYRSMSLFSIEFQQRFHRKPSLLLRESRATAQAPQP